MTTGWNEKSIREELARLDVKTGLKGAKLPISFSNSKKTLGEYSGVGIKTALGMGGYKIT